MAVGRPPVRLKPVVWLKESWEKMRLRSEKTGKDPEMRTHSHRRRFSDRGISLYRKMGSLSFCLCGSRNPGVGETRNGRGGRKDVIDVRHSYARTELVGLGEGCGYVFMCEHILRRIWSPSCPIRYTLVRNSTF
jgi:hypothetical protein